MTETVVPEATPEPAATTPSSVSRIDALKTGVAGIGRRVLDHIPSFSKPDIHITKAGVVKGTAAGGLAVGELLTAAGCAPATTPNATSTEAAHQTPITIVSESPIPTPINSENPTITITESPKPTATVEPTATVKPTPEKTPAPTLKSVESIINPSPSEKPQTPITVEQVKDDFAALIADPNLGLSKRVILVITSQLNTCLSSGGDQKQRLLACGNLAQITYNMAKTNALTNPNTSQAAYKTTFDLYWLVVEPKPNGLIGPGAKSTMDAELLAH